MSASVFASASASAFTIAFACTLIYAAVNEPVSSYQMHQMLLLVTIITPDPDLPPPTTVGATSVGTTVDVGDRAMRLIDKPLFAEMNRLT